MDAYDTMLSPQSFRNLLTVSRLTSLAVHRCRQRRDSNSSSAGFEIKPIRYGPLPPEAATPARTQAIVVLVGVIAIVAIEIVLASEGVAAIAGPAELITVAWPRP